MLDIDTLTRFMLRATGAVEFNDEGDEVLAGLTLHESIFFIKCGKILPADRSIGQIFLFEQLKILHKHAVLKKLWE